jgi:hypothetical protein
MQPAVAIPKSHDLSGNVKQKLLVQNAMPKELYRGSNVTVVVDQRQ